MFELNPCFVAICVSFLTFQTSTYGIFKPQAPSAIPQRVFTTGAPHVSDLNDFEGGLIRRHPAITRENSMFRT